MEFMPAFTWRNVLLGTLIFIGSFLLNLAIVSIILVKLPADHFSKDKNKKFAASSHPMLRVLLIIGKNILGVLLVALGVVLSLPGVPGQGLLTILLGIMLLDFPGRDLEMLRRVGLWRDRDGTRLDRAVGALDVDAQRRARRGR